MANLKNIADLPVAESAEGVNLIIEDNGVAKKLAADSAGLGGTSDAVQYVEQTLTEEQQMQARKNIGLYGNTQTLLDTAELTLENGIGDADVNFDGENYDRSDKNIRVMLKLDGSVAYDLFGTATYIGNPVYAWSAAVNDKNNPNYIALEYGGDGWRYIGWQESTSMDGSYTMEVYTLVTEQVPEEYIPDTIARKNEVLIISEPPQVLTAQSADEVMGRFNELLTALNDLGIIEKNSAPL